MNLTIKQVAEYEAEPAVEILEDTQEGVISDSFALNCYAGRTSTSAVILETQDKSGDPLDRVIIQVAFRDGRMKMIRLKKVEPKADQGGR